MILSKSSIFTTIIRIICPFILLFGVYLIMNGHISPGGGFQGGVVISVLFICRYMIQGIKDIDLEKVKALEKLIYIFIVLLAAFFIFNGAHTYFTSFSVAYLIAMNALIGMKVACGFLIIFYHFVIYERI